MNLIRWHNALITTANTTKTGTGTVSVVVLAPEDIYVDRLVIRAAGSNVATVIRVFVNNGGDNSVVSNNSLFAEETLEATTLDEAAKFADESVTMNLWLPKGYRIFCTLGTTIAAGVQVTAVCGRYQDLQSYQGTPSL
jgi:hypothetical protein